MISTVVSTNYVVKGTLLVNCGAAQGEELSQVDL